MSAVMARAHAAAGTSVPLPASPSPEPAWRTDIGRTDRASYMDDTHDSVLVRATFRAIMQRACVFVALLSVIHCAIFYAVDTTAAIVTALTAAASVPCYLLLDRRRPFAVFLTGLVALVAIVTSAVGYLALHYGRDAGFHLTLLVVVPLIAVTGRIGFRLKWLLIAGQIVLILLLDHYAEPTGASPAWVAPMRALNLGAVALTLGGLMIHYFRIATRQQAVLELHASTDSLTGLWNRRRIGDIAARALTNARRYGHPLTLVLCDLDRFKAINDRYGHETGDAVLRHVAELLHLDLRVSDDVGRWGGEEFALVLPHADLAGGAALAERVRRRVETSPLRHVGGALALTLTLGVAEVAPEESLAQTIARADAAMYGGKSGGRNRVVAAR